MITCMDMCNIRGDYQCCCECDKDCEERCLSTTGEYKKVYKKEDMIDCILIKKDE